MAPKHVSTAQSPEPVNISLFGGKKDFADVIKLRTLRWSDCSGLSAWSHNTITNVLVGEAEGASAHTGERRPWEEGGRCSFLACEALFADSPSSLCTSLIRGAFMRTLFKHNISPQIHHSLPVHCLFVSRHLSPPGFCYILKLIVFLF